MPRKFVMLDHLRWLSAGLVAIGHIRGFWMEDFSSGSWPERAFYFITGFGHQAVMVFFVLSGFLVGRKVIGEAAKPAPDILGYMADRASRIFLVLLPAVAISAAALWWVNAHGAGGYAHGHWGAVVNRPIEGDFAPERWLAALTLTNGLVAPTLAIDAPLWSLSCEWTYYVVAIAAVAIYRRRASWTVPYAMVLAGLMALANTGMAIGGLVWVLGALAGWISDRGWIRGRLTMALTGVAAVGVFALSRVHQVSDLEVGAPIALALAHAGWRDVAWGAWLGDRLAAFSYSLYAIHYPLVLALLAAFGVSQRLPYGADSIAIVLATFACACLIAAVFASQTEARTRSVRRALLKWHAGASAALRRRALDGAG